MELVWIHPLINLFLWVVYLVTGIGCIYFFAPTWGGFASLNAQGKICAFGCAALCLTSMALLLNTTPLPVI